MKTKRIAMWCIQCLLDGKHRTTEQIREYINEKSRYGTTGHGLANILAKDTRFKKVGEIWATRGIGKYKVKVWTLTPEAVMKIRDDVESGRY